MLMPVLQRSWVGLAKECDLFNLYERPPGRFASTNPALGAEKTRGAVALFRPRSRARRAARAFSPFPFLPGHGYDVLKGRKESAWLGRYFGRAAATPQDKA